MKFKLLKKNWLKILLFILGVSALIFISFSFIHSKEKLTGNAVLTPVIFINYSNFEKEISKNYVIQALPNNAKIILKFYNFNAGKRQWEKSFILNKANVTEGTLKDPDITLSLNSKYLKELTNKNFCQIIQKTSNNGELGIDLGMSQVSLIWKYKNILKYRDCFGI
jgi:hypothetical protein